MPQIKSWEISDEFWAKIEPLVPVPSRPKERVYKRKSGGGRKPLAARQVFSAIIYVLRTGCQWNAIPEKFGSSSSVHKYFLIWHKAGFFLQLWRAGLAEYDDMHGIAWEWQSIDGTMNKAPLALECVGRNPTDRGKKWTQTQLADGRQWNPFIARRERGECSRREDSGGNP
jgi:transposase